MQDEHDKTAENTTTEDVSFTLSDDEIRHALNALHAEDSDTIHAVLEELSSADTAELLAKAPPKTVMKSFICTATRWRRMSFLKWIQSFAAPP